MEVQGVTKAGARQGSGRGGRLFSLKHAGRTLPLVKRIVADIVQQHTKVCILEERRLVPHPKDADDERLWTLRKRYDAELDKLRRLADEISAIGCELKDVRRGIVDFRTLYRGQEVELCWRLGQDKIEFWHELSDGFHDRRMIDEDFVAEVSRAES